MRSRQGGTLRAIRTSRGSSRGVSSRDWEAVDPPWLKRPRRPLQDEAHLQRRIGVELDATSVWLDEAFAAAARRFELDQFDLGYVELDLWFTASTDTSSGDPRVAVSIGEQVVGLVDPDATAP